MREGSLCKVCFQHMVDRAKAQGQLAKFYDEELEEWLDERKDSENFRLQMLNIRQMLKREHGIWIIRIQEPKRGYKVASDAEKTVEVYEMQQRRAMAAFADQTACLHSINPENLTDKERESYEKKLTKNATTIGVLSQIRRRKKLDSTTEIKVQFSDPKALLKLAEAEKEYNYE